MKMYFVILAIAFGSNAFAGETGFIYQGKQYIVYKDGEKVGKDFSELFEEKSKQEKKRSVAGLTELPSAEIGFTQDDNHICFYHYHRISAGISCLKRK